MRNTHAAFHLPGGALSGMVHSGLSCMITGGKEPWTLRNKTPDADRTRPAKEFSEIAYPKPDGVLSFDLMTNLMRSGEHPPSRSLMAGLLPGCNTPLCIVSPRCRHVART